ncbi:unnamed protein product [Diatraea saccharalis]|uniref:RRM domain-containing protein n=1 Tax=Diatraea saccharalis TaxID=40085 RepID=A0A9N9WBL3_9NEOP|nr:unnamed protein product [Diatraea saccharalis]
MIDEDNKTLWCGNLPEQVTEEILYELFLQAGPLEKVRIAKDKDGRQKNFAFITYSHEVSVPYAIQLFRGTALFHRTLSLQSRGRIALLPPPIRCSGPDPAVDFQLHINMAQQFAEMTERLKEDDHNVVQLPRQTHDLSDKLVIASLQGNWTHRHHPYRPEKSHGRDDYRHKDNHSDNYKGNNRTKYSGNWRDRRNHKKNYNHRRE